MRNYMKGISLLISICLLLSVGLSSNVFAEEIVDETEAVVDEVATEEETEEAIDEVEEVDETEEVEGEEVEEAVEEVVEEAEEEEKEQVVVTPKRSNLKVLVNGEEKEFEAYLIEGNTYYKLRDLAMVLNGSEKNFEVGWDQENQAIMLTSNTEYTPVGNELVISEETLDIEGILSTSKIFLDGEEVSLDAYLIGQNNYFKLRDIGKLFDFYVGWDQETQTISIDTTLEYELEETEEAEEVEETNEVVEDEVKETDETAEDVTEEETTETDIEDSTTEEKVE